MGFGASTHTVTVASKVASAVSMAASFNSDPIAISSRPYAFLQFSWSGTSPIGTLGVQASSDGVNWADLVLTSGGATTVAISGNTGSVGVDLTTSAPSIRFKYTFTSGVGTVSLTANSKSG